MCIVQLKLLRVLHRCVGPLVAVPPLVASLLVASLLAGGCERRPSLSADAGARVVVPQRSLELPGREPGPPRGETVAEVRRESHEAAQLAASLGQGGVSPRQVASMADIRGYRHYRVRRFRRAQVWFELAVRSDESYELGLYNAARVAVLLDELPLAARRLGKLHALGTPLGARALKLAASDPDLAALRYLLDRTPRTSAPGPE